MKNIKVRTKLIVSFAVVLALFIVSVGISLRYLRSLQAEINDFYQGEYAVRTQANIAKQSFETMQKYLLLATASEDAQVTAQAAENVGLAGEAAQAALAAIAANPAGASSVQDVESALALAETMGPVQDRLTSLAKAGKHSEASALFVESYMGLSEEANAYLDAILERARADGDAMLGAVEAQVQTSLIALVALAAVSAVFTVVISIRITKNITRPVNELKAAAAKMSEGELAVEIGYRAKDELGELAESMRVMANTLDSYVSDIARGMKQLSEGDLTVSPNVEFKGEFLTMAKSIIDMVRVYNDALYQIRKSSDQVANGAGQVAGGAQVMAQGAAEQAGSVEELAASINQISEQVRRNAETADLLNQRAQQVGDSINHSNDQMRDMIRAMAEISSSSGEIGKIIKTIQDIAFQTNILALNAAVEAARAGEAGKGFAVVADEVRNLATKSDEAAKSTTTLIESTVRAVENGTQIAGATASSLELVVTDAQSITAEITKITEASEEQAQAITQLTMGVDQISTVVQTNSATAEESAATSEELSSQAKLLDELLQGFTLLEEG